MAFPKDCWKIDCEHKQIYDLSIDDLVIICKLMGVYCDACEMDDIVPIKCPKEV